jgi:hypothetical protein
MRPDPGGDILPQDLAIFSQSTPVEDKDFLEADDLTLHAGDLRNGNYPADAIGVPG